MIASLEGILVEKRPTEALVAVGGIGLRCRISVATYAALPEPGDTVRLVTHLIAREEGLDLYGFLTEGERLLFLMLQGVSGVGPRMAQGILSGLSVEEFMRAVGAEDVGTLTAVKGIGRTTAERLILELKDRRPQLAETIGTGPPPAAVGEPAWLQESVLALRSLGYVQADAERAVRRAADQIEAEPTVEAVVKRALTLTR